MARTSYSEIIRNAAEHLRTYAVIPLTSAQVQGMKRYCKSHDTFAGHDRINHFFLYAGIYYYNVDFIKTSYSGDFVKIKKNLIPVR